MMSDGFLNQLEVTPRAVANRPRTTTRNLKKMQLSLGILYQSKNMRTSAESKGIFEEAQQPFNLSESHVDLCDLTEARLQVMHKKRS